MNSINEHIAMIFEEMAVMLEMDDVAFKPRAYEKAAQQIRNFPESLDVVYRQKGRDGLDAIPGVGTGLAEKIEEFLQTGRLGEYERYVKKYPVRISELRSVEGLGPKMIKELYQECGIRTLRDLEKAVKNHTLRSLPHLGEKKEERRGLP